MRKRKTTYRYSLENPNGKRPFGRPRLRGDDNITTDLKDIGLKRVEWINLSHNGDNCWVPVNKIMNSGVIKLETFLERLSF
jgi:hypothetical protein